MPAGALHDYRKRIKTSEIYTHVSQKDFQKFRNPIDDMFFDDG